MIQCPKCSAENSDDSRFCKSCAEPLSSLSQAPTVTAPEGDSPPAPMDAPHVGRIVSSDSVPAGGFTPGTILADRYRIIGLLGRGGMGEVYRADDLKLGQPVALKFLPPKLAEDSVRRERFFAEVRITRQLSHPNICRVYDIGEVDGRHFLSMEYIDGEDLASLMKRIGHLSNEKALDIARQLVAGLSVAHERGVLHRDLKPANIMLDGHGRVRITDFGLAIAAEDESQAEEIAGTPAYMAPEQLAGKGATVRSDIYSLGLILYEVYTGKKAFKAKTLAELREQKETQTPRAPSELREGVDPVVERVIQRCMEKDPNSRPASVAQLAQALPGGDPLAAAIAAGETPSPEMVAASGSKEGLRPAIAWAFLVIIILGIFATVLVKQHTDLFLRLPIKERPEVFAKTARDILENVGYTETFEDQAYGFNANEFYFQYVERNERSPNRFETLPAFAVQFWYRQSPLTLESLEVSMSSRGVTLSDPPFINAGESVVSLDSSGNLIGLQVIPKVGHKPSSEARSPDWLVLFKAAGLDLEEFDDVDPDWTRPVYSDSREAWVGELPDLPGVPIRIEAAALQGNPILWQMSIPSWDNLEITAADSSLFSDLFRYRAVAICIVLVLAAFFVRRNLHTGRGDRHGANRLAWAIFVLFGCIWLFGVHHIATMGEADLLLRYISLWLFFAGIAWMIYIALEPYIRRQFPVWLISWNRLLSGNIRDPLVGRDILVGCVAGIFLVFLNYLRFFITPLIGMPQLRPSALFMILIENAGIARIGTLHSFSGTHSLVAFVSGALASSIAVGLAILFWIFVFRILFRRTWAVVIAAMTWIIFANSIGSEFSIISLISVAAAGGLSLFVIFRFGLVAFIAEALFFNILLASPITIELSAWYSEIGLMGLFLLLALSLYAFHTSLGGRPIFGTSRLDD